MTKKTVALFDLDGVILDTESQYSLVWGRIGKTYHPDMADFAYRIKGMTLVNIFKEYFGDSEQTQAEVTKILDDFEANEMRYDFIAGAREFLVSLREAGVRVALVTSSNEQKMTSVRSAVADFDSLFDGVVTSEMTRRSKPAPDCFLVGAEFFGASSGECVVFEDSKNGLRAGRAAGMFTVGVATTFARTEIEPLADTVIDNFLNIEPNKFF